MPSSAHRAASINHLPPPPSSPLSFLPSSSPLSFPPSSPSSVPQLSVNDTASDVGRSVGENSFSRDKVRVHRRLEKQLTDRELDTIKKIEELMRTCRWRLSDVMVAYTRLGAEQRRVKLLAAAVTDPRVQALAATRLDPEASVKPLATRFRKEWKKVAGKGFFGRIDKESGASFRDLVPNDTYQELSRKAPLWVCLLLHLLQPQRVRPALKKKQDRQRTRQQDDTEDDDSSTDNDMNGDCEVPERLKKRAIAITHIFLGVFARDMTNGWRTLLGSYLHSSGTQKRAIEVLAGIGLTPTYKSVNAAQNEMAARAEVSLRR